MLWGQLRPSQSAPQEGQTDIGEAQGVLHLAYRIAGFVLLPFDSFLSPFLHP